MTRRSKDIYSIGENGSRYSIVMPSHACFTCRPHCDMNVQRNSHAQIHLAKALLFKEEKQHDNVRGVATNAQLRVIAMNEKEQGCVTALSRMAMRGRHAPTRAAANTLRNVTVLSHPPYDVRLGRMPQCWLGSRTTERIREQTEEPIAHTLAQSAQ